MHTISGMTAQILTQKTSNSPTFDLLRGDALTQLETVASESIDACITDAPYGLTNGLDVEELLGCWLRGETYTNLASGFGGEDWDNAVPGPELWRAVHRTLKPGGFTLVFSAARTVGLTQLALQLAGFEVRDLIYWVYAPGRQATREQGKVARENGLVQADIDRLTGLRPTLRPGHEPIVIARKPLDECCETVAENYLDYGVGLISHNAVTGTSGRCASNVWVLHDLHCSEKSCLCQVPSDPAAQSGTHLFPSNVLGKGSLAVAKAGYGERPVGPDGTTHCTVKPLALMAALIEAVTVPGQVVLDPFLGSGTTAEAALLAGRNAIGCEMAGKYWPLIEARIQRAKASSVCA